MRQHDSLHAQTIYAIQYSQQATHAWKVDYAELDRQNQKVTRNREIRGNWGDPSFPSACSAVL